MAYSLDQVISTLHNLKETSRSLARSCRKVGLGEYDSVARELNSLYDTTVDISIALYRGEFKAVQDVEQLTDDIGASATSALVDLRLLQPLLPASLDNAFTLSPEGPSQGDRLKVQNIGNNIYKRTRSLQRRLDVIGGREDWSNLSPRIPRAPSPPPAPPPTKEKHTLLVIPKTVSFSSNASSSGSKSAPPSPFQPSVEEVPDKGEDEESHDVEFYHVDPANFVNDKKPMVRPAEEPPTPPRVMIRSPTDPNGIVPEAKPVNLDSVLREDLSRQADVSNAWGVKHSLPNDSGIATYPNLSSHSLTKPQREHQSREDIEAEIRRLEAEVARLTPPNGSDSSRSHSRNSHSVDLGVNNSGSNVSVYNLQQPLQNRQRASTASSAERPLPPSSRTHSGDGEPDDYPHSMRLAHISPRYSPRATGSPRSPGLQQRAERHGSSGRENRESVYGPGPNTSLPAVLESGRREEGLGSGRDGKRASWAYPADALLFPDLPATVRGAGERGGDFELFGGSASQNHLRSPPTKQDDVPPGVTEKKLPVSLEDLCNGASKKVRFHRKVPDARGMRLVLEEVILDVPIYKGLKPGSRVKFRGEGDYVEWTAQRGDLWFLLVEKDHEVFTRRHLDLHTIIEVPLCDALCGWSKSIRSICGKQVRVSHAGPTPHGWREAYAGLGMPKYKDGGGEMERGDLVVEVKLVWPGRVEEWQKDLLKQALGGSGRVVG